MTEIEIENAVRAAMAARRVRWLAGLQVGDKVKVRDGVSSTIIKITACQFALSDKTRINRNDGSVRGEMGKISEIAVMDRMRTMRYARSEINCLEVIEAEERAKIMAEIAAKAAEVNSKKCDVVTIKRRKVAVEQLQPANEPATQPSLAQCHAIKTRYPNALAFYRMGDFYEAFYADAEKVALLLDITLDKRGQSAGESVVGVPRHALDGHMDRLHNYGKGVALCEFNAKAGQWIIAHHEVGARSTTHNGKIPDVLFSEIYRRGGIAKVLVDALARRD